MPFNGTGSNVTSLNASNIASGTVPTARLASGTANNTTYLRGDQTWAAVSAGTVIPAGTVMIFAQTAAPTGFTKLTNLDNYALRVVSGTASTGGSVAFTTAFASQTPSGSINVGGLSAGATTLSTTQIPSHNHSYTAPGGGYGPVSAGKAGLVLAQPGSGASTGSTGGGGSHTHSISGSATFSGNAINLAVQYVDVIRASKD